MSKSRYPLDPDSDGSTVDCGHTLQPDDAGEHHMGHRLCRPCAKELHKSMLEHDLVEASRQLKELGE